MPRPHSGPYTCIYRELWNKEKFLLLSDDAKLVFIHLITTTFGTQFGFFKMGIGGLADELGWSSDRYKVASDEVISAGHAEHDPATKTWFIPEYVECNPPNSINILKAWGKVWKSLPECDNKYKCRTTLKQVLEETRPSFMEYFESCFVIHTDRSSLPKTMAKPMAKLLPKAMASAMPKALPKTSTTPENVTPQKANNNSEFLPKPMPKPLARPLAYPDPPEQCSDSGSGSETPTVFSQARDRMSQFKEEYEYVGEVKNLSQHVVKTAVERFGDWPQDQIEQTVLRFRAEFPDLSAESWEEIINEAFMEAAPGSRPQKYHEVLYRKIKWFRAKEKNISRERHENTPSASFWTPSGMSRPRGAKTARECLERLREDKKYPAEKLDRWEKEIAAHGE